MQALPPPFPLQIAKTVSTEMFDSVSLLQDSIQLSLTKAEKDNGSVYLQRVPAFAELPPTQGAMLVKATPPTCLQPLPQVCQAPPYCLKALTWMGFSTCLCLSALQPTSLLLPSANIAPLSLKGSGPVHPHLGLTPADFCLPASCDRSPCSQPSSQTPAPRH